MEKNEEGVGEVGKVSSGSKRPEEQLMHWKRETKPDGECKARRSHRVSQAAGAYGTDVRSSSLSFRLTAGVFSH